MPGFTHTETCTHLWKRSPLLCKLLVPWTLIHKEKKVTYTMGKAFRWKHINQETLGFCRGLPKAPTPHQTGRAVHFTRHKYQGWSWLESAFLTYFPRSLRNYYCSGEKNVCIIPPNVTSDVTETACMVCDDFLRGESQVRNSLKWGTGTNNAEETKQQELEGKGTRALVFGSRRWRLEDYIAKHIQEIGMRGNLLRWGVGTSCCEHHQLCSLPV